MSDPRSVGASTTSDAKPKPVTKKLSKKNAATVLSVTALTTNLVSRILFLHYHLSAIPIT